MSKTTRNAPTVESRIPIVGSQGASSTSSSASSKSGSTPQTVSTRIVNAVLMRVPSPDLEQVSYSIELPYNIGAILASPTLQVSMPITTIPNERVFIMTDIVFYALRRGSLNDPLFTVDDHALTGIFVFNILIQGKEHMSLASVPAGAYTVGASPVVPTYPLVSGWGRLNTKFGPSRTIPFAIYANQREDVVFTVRLISTDQTPRFDLVKFGVEIGGIILPVDTFLKQSTALGRAAL